MHPLHVLRRAPVWLATLLLTLFVVGCNVSKNPISGNKRAFGYSWEQEKQLGAESDPQIVAQFGLVEDEALTNYVERIGQEVLAESHLRREDTDPKFRDIEFTFRVLDSPVVNAFALPGGFIYVTRGLLAHLNNEAQLAVVLGHEITHVAGRHASKRAAKAQFAQIGLIGGAILGQEVLGGAAGESILNLGGTAAQLLFLKYSREDERESDRFGIEYAALAGYDATEGAEFFRSLDRIQEQAGGAIPSWQSSHPDPGDREQFMVERGQEWKQRVTASEIDREQYLQQIEGIILGDNPREGFVENGVFYHPELAFQFAVPSGFGLQNGQTQVVMIEQNQQAIMVFTFAPEASSVEAAADQFGRQQGLSVVNQGTARIGRFPAAFVVADAQLQDGTPVRLLSYYVEYGGTIYQFLGYTTQSAFDRYDDAFMQSIRSFSEVTDRDILNIEPSRLNVVAASQTAPFRDLLPRTLPAQFSPEELAILNQVQLDETVERGRPIKLPR